MRLATRGEILVSDAKRNIVSVLGNGVVRVSVSNTAAFGLDVEQVKATDCLSKSEVALARTIFLVDETGRVRILKNRDGPALVYLDELGVPMESR